MPWYRRRQMHCKSNGANNAARVIDQVDELPEASFSTKVNNVVQWRMVVVLSNKPKLDELNAIPEVIDNPLYIFWNPPLCGVVALATGADEPIRKYPVDRILLD